MKKDNRHDRDRKFIARRKKQLKELMADDFIKFDGQLRKAHPLDCGKPNCSLCHSYKVRGHEETKQEAEARIKMEEQVRGV